MPRFTMPVSRRRNRCPGKPGAAQGKLDQLGGVIDALLAAVRAGELDAQLAAAAQERSKAFKRRSGGTKTA